MVVDLGRSQEKFSFLFTITFIHHKHPSTKKTIRMIYIQLIAQGQRKFITGAFADTHVIQLDRNKVNKGC